MVWSLTPKEIAQQHCSYSKHRCRTEEMTQQKCRPLSATFSVSGCRIATVAQTPWKQKLLPILCSLFVGSPLYPLSSKPKSNQEISTILSGIYQPVELGRNLGYFRLSATGCFLVLRFCAKTDCFSFFRFDSDRYSNDQMLHKQRES